MANTKIQNIFAHWKQELKKNGLFIEPVESEKDKLTTKNLFLKWKHCKVIECDDLEQDKFHWQRIAVLEYKGKLYYVVINSGKISKVIPLEEMPYKYYNETIYNTDTDTKVENILGTLKNEFGESQN